MSEKEIIETLQDLIEAKFSIKEIRTMNLLNENDEMPYVLTIFERHTIQDLLDLYNKEKEKNASLQKEIKLMKSININDNYISKDKIKEMIKEIGTYTFDSEEEIKKFDYCIYILKELLEEGDK